MRQFRCFGQTTLTFDHPLILIEGDNGAGKTSILEAIHYLCYLKSFRTHVPKELVSLDAQSFFVAATVTHMDGLDHDLQVGFVEQRRALKLNEQPLKSYKELMGHYRVITLTEDDLYLIKSGPDIRRGFIDQYCWLHDTEYLTVIKKYELTVKHKAALLHQAKWSSEEYTIWSASVWQQTTAIQDMRKKHLSALEDACNKLLNEYFPGLGSIHITYKPKIQYAGNFEECSEAMPYLEEQERRTQRLAYGAHLDDFVIEFQERQSKSFASRGQQKLVVLLLKIAQIKQLINNHGPSIFLLDDFMTDFDEKRLQCLLPLLESLNCQLIFTSPLCQSPLKKALLERNAQLITLSDNTN
jgi:DNA replication and repair protein RecF